MVALPCFINEKIKAQRTYVRRDFKTEFQNVAFSVISCSLCMIWKYICSQYICVYVCVCIHTCACTHIYDICIISNIYCCWIIQSVTFWRLHKRSSFSSSNICSSWRPWSEINRRSNFKFPMLELRILNNDLEIWISTFPREEVAKWHSLLLSANPISWKFNLQWILGAT